MWTTWKGVINPHGPSHIDLYPLIIYQVFFHRNSALYYLINQSWKSLQGVLGLIGTYEQSMIKRFSHANSDDSRRADRELNEFIYRVRNNEIALGIVLFPSLVETGGEIGNYPFGFLFSSNMLHPKFDEFF